MTADLSQLKAKLMIRDGRIAFKCPLTKRWRITGYGKVVK